MVAAMLHGWGKQMMLAAREHGVGPHPPLHGAAVGCQGPVPHQSLSIPSESVPPPWSHSMASPSPHCPGRREVRGALGEAVEERSGLDQ